MAIEVLDPTYDEDDRPFVAATRLTTLSGATIGVVSNGKQGTGRFFEAFANHLCTKHGVAKVEHVTKPNYSAPAGDEIMDATQTWNALVSGIGD